MQSSFPQRWRERLSPFAQFGHEIGPVMRVAERLARRDRHEFIASEYILLALLETAPNAATRLLEQCHLGSNQLRRAVERRLIKGPPFERLSLLGVYQEILVSLFRWKPPRFIRLQLTPRAETALRIAMAEQDRALVMLLVGLFQGGDFV